MTRGRTGLSVGSYVSQADRRLVARTGAQRTHRTGSRAARAARRYSLARGGRCRRSESSAAPPASTSLGRAGASVLLCAPCRTTYDTTPRAHRFKVFVEVARLTQQAAHLHRLAAPVDTVAVRRLGRACALRRQRACEARVHERGVCGVRAGVREENAPTSVVRRGAAAAPSASSGRPASPSALAYTSTMPPSSSRRPRDAAASAALPPPRAAARRISSTCGSSSDSSLLPSAATNARGLSSSLSDMARIGEA